MTIRTITEPAAEPLTLTEGKAQCKVEHSVEDALISIYIGASREQWEELTGRSIITRTLEQVLDAFPDGALKLGRPPVQSIVSVQYIPAGSTSLTTLDPSAYVLDDINGPGWVLPVSAWPATADLANSVRVQFTAGYASDATSVPFAIKVWLLLNTGGLYDNRSPFDSSGRITALPNRDFDRWLDGFMTYYE